ncbi:MAG: hypothetical protein JST98_12045 [Bacteroidetes bacterium]|nr:hypothetical protein [Bacteroidota bacterium]
MLTRHFRQDRPTAYLPVPLLLLLLWPGAGTGGASYFSLADLPAREMVEGMPFHRPVQWLLALSPWAALAVSVAIIFGVAYSLDRLANNAELYVRRNHLPALLFPLLLALAPFGLLADPAMVGLWPVLWALGLLWRAVGRANIRGALFDGGLLLGLASLFYLPYGFLIVVLWATLAHTRPLNFREYVLPVAGMAAVLATGWGLVHFLAPGTWHPAASLHFPKDVLAPKEAHWMYRIVLTAVLGALALAAIISFGAMYGRSVLREKNIRASFLAFAFAMALLACFAWWLDRRIPPVLMAAPGALLAATPLLQPQQRGATWADAVPWALLLLACWARWAG